MKRRQSSSLSVGSGNSFGSSSVLDPKFALSPQEAAENTFISASAQLSQYSNQIQKCFNEILMAAAMLSSGTFAQSTSLTADALNFASSIASSLPLASMVLSTIASGYNTASKATTSANLQNIAALNPSSNPVLMGVISEAIAREFTLTYHTEINQGLLTKDKSSISRLKDGFRSFFGRINGGDSKLARGLVGPELTDIQCVAVNQASMAIAYITSLTMVQVSELAIEVNTDRRVFAARLVTKVMEKFPVTGPRAEVVPAVPVPQSTDQTAGLTATGGEVDSGSKSEKIASLEAALLAEKDLAKQALLKADNAEKKADQTRRILDAFVDTTGIGAGGQVQAAVRTKDGTLNVVVTSPASDRRLDAVAESVGEIQANYDEVADLRDRPQRQEEEMQRMKKKDNKKSTKCVLA